MSYQAFRNKFRYNPDLAGYVGVEREFFLTDPHGVMVPQAHRVMTQLENYRQPVATLWPSIEGRNMLAALTGYELSVCQIETRTRLTELTAIKKELSWIDRELDAVLAKQDLRKVSREVGPADMPLDVYPDPTGRYQTIVERLTRQQLLAGCRVIGTHVHIGMPDHDAALQAYNYACMHVDGLCELGNGSFGERFAIYRQMAPKWRPEPYVDWRNFYETAKREKFEEDPRQCWSIIRLSVRGTVGFRMFGATDSIDRIVEWAKICHDLCEKASEYRAPVRQEAGARGTLEPLVTKR